MKYIFQTIILIQCIAFSNVVMADWGCNLVVNPYFETEQIESCSVCNTECYLNVYEDCFDGWINGNSDPTVKKNNGAFIDIAIWAKKNDPSSEGYIGTFSKPLVVGKTYKLSFQYKADNPNEPHEGVNKAKVQLSTLPEFQVDYNNGILNYIGAQKADKTFNIIDVDQSYNWHSFEEPFVADIPVNYIIFSMSPDIDDEFHILRVKNIQLVEQDPPVPAITPQGPISVCSYDYPNGYTLTATPGAEKYHWYMNGQPYKLIEGSNVFNSITIGNPTFKVMSYKDGCWSGFSNEVTVNQKAGPLNYITVNGAMNDTEITVCHDEQVTLKGHENANYTYQWYRDGGQMNGETSDELVLNDPSQSDKYKLQVSYQGCDEFTIEVDVTILPIFTVTGQLSDNLLEADVEVLTASIDPVPNMAFVRFHWGDGTSTVTAQNQATKIYDDPGQYTVTVEVYTENTCLGIAELGQVTVVGPLCNWKIPLNMNGSFKKDKATGLIVWEDNNCNKTYFMPCIKENGSAFNWPKVVSVSANTLDDKWAYEDEDYEYQGVETPAEANDFERGKLGKWRPHQSFAYKTEIDNENAPAIAGTYNLDLFNWVFPESNNSTKWIKTSLVEKYSPDGNMLQELNALEIPSTAQFGYNQYLPIIIATNASEDEVYFESFEMLYGDAPDQTLEYGFPYNETEIDMHNYPLCHAGNKGVELEKNQQFTMPSFTLTEHISSKGIIVKMWVQVINEFLDELSDELYVKVKVGNNMQAQKFPAKVIANVGYWSLVEFYVDDFGACQAGGEFRPVLFYDNIYLQLDDVIVKPSDAKTNTFVYDTETHRLVAQFDDQHFGVYFQYDAEGKLIRKSLETERGLKTIQETHYHVPDKEN